MRPVKGKTYYIDFTGECDYQHYHGSAVCTDDIPSDPEGWYEFTLSTDSKSSMAQGIMFDEKSIIKQMKTPIQGKKISKKKAKEGLKLDTKFAKKIDDDFRSKKLKKGQIVYIQYETGQYVLQGDVTVLPVKEEYDAASDPKNKSGIGEG